MTENDGAFIDYFGSSVAISVDTLLVWDSGKYDGKGDVYACVLSGDGSWDEVTNHIPINVIASRDSFGYAVFLYGARALFGAYPSG